MSKHSHSVIKLISWNVNGVRSAARQGLLEYLSMEQPDFLCLQETKAEKSDLEEALLTPFGYKSLWVSAEKRGYSGLAVYSKADIDHVPGLGIPEFDREGRTILCDLGDTVLINAYFPNSQRDHARLGYKLDYCQAFLEKAQKLVREKKNVIMCGDFNIAHKEIDLANPKTNVNNAGFLPEERAWMDKFVAAGFVDTFREKCKEPQKYSWWSYRPGVRERNIGWRLDYFFVNKDLKLKIIQSSISPEVLGSDHCPVTLEINL